jgi:hypothetical protein
MVKSLCFCLEKFLCFEVHKTLLYVTDLIMKVIYKLNDILLL